MYRRLPVFAYIILALIAIGILSRFVSDPAGMIIPVAVFGIVFFLYKFPPGRWRRQQKPTPRYAKAKEKRKQVPFKVINGSKPDDDDMPKYH